MDTIRIIFRVHAVQRMFERQINADDVKLVLETGEMIENYPDDTPYPSRLLLGWISKRPLHVVVAENRLDKESIIITVYEPDSELWEPDFKRRKQ